MRPIRRLTIVAVAFAALAAGISGSAFAAEEPFGQHVSMCAHELGKRADTPAVTCRHDGMPFLVQHMRDMH